MQSISPVAQLALPPPALPPHLDPKRIAEAEPAAGFASHTALYLYCSRAGKIPPSRADVERAGVPHTAAQVLLAWFPDFQLEGKWALTLGLAAQLAGLAWTAPSAPSEDKRVAGDGAHAPKPAAAPSRPAPQPAPPPASDGESLRPNPSLADAPAAEVETFDERANEEALR